MLYKLIISRHNGRIEGMGFKEQLKNFLLNPVWLSCLTSWFCAQFIKTVTALCRHSIKHLSDLFALMIWRTGGMPSSHSSLVSALCTSLAFREGLTSNIFILSFCLFLITTRDAFGVRRTSGIQAKKLNDLGAKLDERGIVSYTPIKVVQGHTPLEVLSGIVLGFLIGLAFYLLK